MRGNCSTTSKNNIYEKIILFLIITAFTALCPLGNLLFAGYGDEGDTDIYERTFIKPNVLLVVETSNWAGSNRLKYEAYINTANYETGLTNSFCGGGTVGCVSGAVYKIDNNSPTLFANSVNDIVSSDARTALSGFGRWQGNIKYEAGCGNVKYADCLIDGICNCDYLDLRTGNYLNYQRNLSGTTSNWWAIDVEREVIKNILNTITGVRWGLMVNNSNPRGIAYDDWDEDEPDFGHQEDKIKPFTGCFGETCDSPLQSYAADGKYSGGRLLVPCGDNTKLLILNELNRGNSGETRYDQVYIKNFPGDGGQDRPGYFISPDRWNAIAVRPPECDWDNCCCLNCVSSSQRQECKKRILAPWYSSFPAMASVLYDAGAYFAHKPTYGTNFAHKGQWPNVITVDRAGARGGTNQMYTSANTTSALYDDPMINNVNGNNFKLSCQKNYVIVLTHGGFQVDEGSYMGTEKFNKNFVWVQPYLFNRSDYRIHPGADFALPNNQQPYCNGVPCDYDRDRQDPYLINAASDAEGTYGSWKGYGAHYFDDLAKFLYNNDIRMEPDETDMPGRQNVTTYVIALRNPKPVGGSCNCSTDPNCETCGNWEMSFLTSATQGNSSTPWLTSGGTTTMSTKADALHDAYNIIVRDIIRQSSTFAAPVVPISPTNRLYSGNWAYFSYFQPGDQGIWNGNIKKYRIGDNGQICDINGACQNPNSREYVQWGGVTSYWSGTADGNNVLAGGLGGKMYNDYGTNNVCRNGAGTSRRFFTHNGGDTTLTHKTLCWTGGDCSTSLDNLIVTNNPQILGSGITTCSATNAYLPLNIPNVLASDRTLNPCVVADNLTKFARYEGDWLKDSNGRRWPLGDIVHSRTATISKYTTDTSGNVTNNKNILFVSSNDGYLHCIVDDLTVSGAGSVWEEWAYVPFATLAKLPSIHPNYKGLFASSSTHYYMNDGTPVIYKINKVAGCTTNCEKDVYLTFGQRRGGGRSSTGAENSQYTTLNIGEMDSSGKLYLTGADGKNTGYEYNKVKFVGQYNYNYVNGNNGTTNQPLGQSWGAPRYTKFLNPTSAGTPPSMEIIDALMMPGGYDYLSEDSDPPTTPIAIPSSSTVCTTPGTSCAVGRMVYVVKPIPESVAGGVANQQPAFVTMLPNVNNTALPKTEIYRLYKRSIVDLTVFASGTYKANQTTLCPECIDTIYAGDMGGNIYAIKDSDGYGVWNYTHLFDGSISGTDQYLKVFYPPDVTLGSNGFGKYDYVFWGTGDRENPKNTTTVNRFYAAKNYYTSNGVYFDSPNNIGNAQIINENNAKMLDVTSWSNNSTANSARKTQLQNSKQGWFIRLILNDDGTVGTTSTGEKVVSSPVVYDGIAYFTTYTPYTMPLTDNPCSTATQTTGKGRLYVLDFETGDPVFNYTGNHNDKATSPADRFIPLGDNMPTGVTLVSTPQGMRVLVATGTGGYYGAAGHSLTRLPRTEYWRQQ
jgi:hypothetical protein